MTLDDYPLRVEEALDGGWDGDEWGNSWDTGYWIEQQRSKFTLFYGEPKKGNGDFIDNTAAGDGCFPTLEATRAAAHAHLTKSRECALHLTEQLEWSND